MATKKTSSTAAKTPAKTAAKTAAKTPAKKTAAKTPSTSETLGTKPAAPAKKAAPTHDDIAKLAHSYWEKRGHHHGSHHDDWLRAEKELNS